MNRREMMLRAGALGCSLAASPLITPVALARAPGENRLVVIILRGAMDGLDVVRPVGAREYAAMRPGLNRGAEALPLDGFFALHPALDGLHMLWQAGELAFAHAVSTPYRDKRSHFDGQDILEAGVAPGMGIRDGWLNRALTLLPSSDLRTAFAVGREDMLILEGAAPVARWAPDTQLELSAQSRLLLARLYRDAPLFREALGEALLLSEPDATAGAMEQQSAGEDDAMAGMLKRARRGARLDHVARFAGEQLRGQTRIASFSISGWDTHANQAGVLPGVLRRLEGAILALRDTLGPVWARTTVLAMTEFGRTARENGTGGTDHGTGGAMLMAGGALRGGKVYGDWPGLGELDLYDGRDLMPTADLRGYCARALHALFGLAQSDIEARVFPGLESGGTPDFLG